MVERLEVGLGVQRLDRDLLVGHPRLCRDVLGPPTVVRRRPGAPIRDGCEVRFLILVAHR